MGKLHTEMTKWDFRSKHANYGFLALELMFGYGHTRSHVNLNKENFNQNYIANRV